jgi:hypothetical protein
MVPPGVAVWRLGGAARLVSLPPDVDELRLAAPAAITNRVGDRLRHAHPTAAEHGARVLGDVVSNAR